MSSFASSSSTATVARTHHADVAQQALDRCRALGASAADVMLAASHELAVSHRGGMPEDLHRAESAALGIRVFDGQKHASVSTTDLSPDAVNACCQRAIAMARHGQDDPYTALAERSLWPASVAALDLADSAEPSLDWLQTQCAIAEDTALSQAGITNSEGASASFGRTDVTIATSAGFSGSYRSTLTSLSLSVIATGNESMERDYAYHSVRHHADLDPAAALGLQAAEQTLRRLNPRRAKSGTYPVILDPRVGRGLLSQLLGAISGTSVARGTTFLKDAMGEALFAPAITIIDEPHRLRGLGSKPFDAEGVANRTRALVEGGVLQSWLLDLRSANQLELATTGHASRSVGGLPHPSSTNCYIAAGTESPAALIASVSAGLYVTELFGSGVNLVTGDYSQGASGIWIENGVLTHPVSEITLAGHLRDIFRSAVAADDLSFRYATNTPTLRVDGLMLGGSI